jgi:SLOG family YspA-like protein
MKPFRLIVAGMRDWNDQRAVFARLDAILKLRPNLILVHGACPTGADAIAGRWSRRRGVKVERHPPNWAVYGKRAGPRRNEAMAERGANYCLVFWDGKSRGTGSMYRAARRAGIPTRQVKPRPMIQRG